MSKSFGVAAYTRTLFNSSQFIETKISDKLSKFLIKQKKNQNICQLFPHTFSKAVDKSVKQKKDQGSMQAHRSVGVLSMNIF